MTMIKLLGLHDGIIISSNIYQVEYLESNSNQYIDTGVVPVFGMTVTADVYITGTKGGNFPGLFGTRVSASNTDGISFSATYESTYTATNIYGNGRDNVAGHAYMSRDKIHHIVLSKDGLQNNADFFNWNPVPTSMPDNAGSMLVFRVRNKHATQSLAPICRFYSFTIENANKKIIDLAPVCFTNENNTLEGAMYDKVSGSLFRNKGTGAFTYGQKINVQENT